MSAHLRIVTLAAGCLSVFTLVPRSAADVLDKIHDLATDARNRAKEARDAAKDAGKTAKDIRTRIERAVDSLSEDAVTAILETGQQVTDEIAAAKADYDEFVSGEGCEECRAELIAGLTNLQAIIDQLMAQLLPCVADKLGLDPPDISLQPLIMLVENGDCRVLFPICEALRLSLCVLEDLQDASQAMQTIQDLVGPLEGLLGEDESNEPVEILPALDETNPLLPLHAERFAARVSASQKFLVHYDALSKASKRLKAKAFTLKTLASTIQINEKERKATIGLHGYLLIDVDLNKAKKLKEILNWVDFGFTKIATSIDAKLAEANTVAATHLVLTNQLHISKQIAQIQAVNGTGGEGGAAASLFGSTTCGSVAMAPLALIAGLGLLRTSPGVRRRLVRVFHSRA